MSNYISLEVNTVAIIIPAAVLAAPAVCHTLRKRTEEEKKVSNKPDTSFVKALYADKPSDKKEED